MVRAMACEFQRGSCHRAVALLLRRQRDYLVPEGHTSHLWGNGSNPKERRAQIRETLDPGYYLCRSGKKKIRTLHRLGDCYALPDVDYLDYDFLGTSMPKRSTFDVICQLCAKRKVHTSKEDSSASQSSSSSEEMK